MPTMRYSVTQPPIDTIFSWIKSGEIAIPEIQRPFVWSAVQVRNLLDSLFQGYPVGYLIAWKNPDVKLKDGTSSFGKRVLIDGQQRVTALMAALLGREVVNKDYQKQRIRIGFHPVELKFEVSNPAIAKDPGWIPDVSAVFDPHCQLFALVTDYCARSSGTTQEEIFRSLERLRGMTSNQIGIIELNPDLDIETVTEIFIRVNSEGVPLSQADFAMSKIAVNEKHHGPLLRKAIDYFCHVAAYPEAFSLVREDAEFAKSDFFQPLVWLKNENSDLYDPSYNDMLRVAFTSEFRRGRLEDLVALLSGRNFETRQYEEAIVDDSFDRLKQGILRFMNETNFQQLVMILKSAGFVDSSMIGSQNAVNFAYILYLTLRKLGMPKGEIERWVRRWFAFSLLTGRFTGASETTIDYDIRQIDAQGIEAYASEQFRGNLSDAFWEASLPQAMNTSVASSPYFRLFEAAQIKANDKGFLSRDIEVRDLVENKSDVHHIFPREFLKKHGVPRGMYNQIANYAVCQSEINIAIGSKEPSVYLAQAAEQCKGGPKKYGSLDEPKELRANLAAHCIPPGAERMTVNDYGDFLWERRKLMARKIRWYFESL
jgi:hypothetical protein